MIKNKKYSTKTQKRSNKLLILPLVAALVLAGGLGYFFWQKRDNKTTIQSNDGTVINLEPATEEEQAEADQNKDRITEEENKEDTDSPTTPNKTAVVSIVDASQYGQEIEVRARISGVIESGGTCKATFTLNGQTVTGQSKGESDASATTCPTITIPRADFPAPGEWSVDVSYSSTAASGSSTTKVRIE